MDSETDLPTRRSKQPRRLGGMVAVVISLSVLVGAGVFVVNAVGGGIQQIVDRFTVADYPGPGGDPVEVVIPAGANGEDVARLLVEADVVQSFDAVYQPMLDLEPTIFPGTFSFPTQIPGIRAVEIILEGDNRVFDQLRLREGLTLTQTLNEIESQVGISVEEMQAELVDLEALGIDNPANTAEGYLFPATYQLDPGTTATELVQTMLRRLDQELAQYDLDRSEAHELLTLASVIQLEARQTQDFYKVSTVFNNRLDIDMPLQSDATVNYANRSESVTTTDEERADDNPYNTYFYRGLPIGPIGNPGSLAIDASLNPEAGDWLYFVTVDLDTGETVFSETLRQHEIAVLDFQAFCRANPGRCG